MSVLCKRFLKHSSFFIVLTATLVIVISSRAFAQNTTDQIPIASELFSAVNTTWMLIAALLVFLMNAGLAMLYAGICQPKNVTNVLAQNLIVFCVSTAIFFVFGFRFIFGDSGSPVFGQFEFFIDSLFPSTANLNPFPQDFEYLRLFWGDRSFAAIFLFQLSLAITTATIVSGAVAERVRFWAFILFSGLLVGLIYPLVGYWVWGENGWLANSLNFHDFAGATVIHCVGGTAALVGTWLLKPRDGRFGYDAETDSFPYGERVKTFEPCHPGFTTLGCLILWVGWLGFNSGSTRFIDYVPHIMMTTMLAAASGGLASIFYSPLVTGHKVKLLSIINGSLGGLVSISASSAYVDSLDACVIGAIGGILVAVGERFLKSRLIRIDDPVNAVPIHLFCGVWGTAAVGIFAQGVSREFDSVSSTTQQTIYQLLGCSCVIASTLLLSLLAWVGVGLFLYYLSPGGFYKNAKGATNILALVRKGLRISFKDEQADNDTSIIM
ncbi:MAG: ammonium transporter [Leptolyngbyaceae cyanobacterium MAG.088]|nr:ammonium transporter [Leptolyngbyaceae cyanobacterium MAG.088]